MKTVRRKIKGRSIKFRIAAALFALVTVQGLILLLCINLTGAVRKNDIAAYNILANQSSSRVRELQGELNTRRKNITNVSLELSAKIERMLSAKGGIVDSLALSEASSSHEMQALVLEELAAFTRYCEVTGAFAVLDPTPEILSKEKPSRTSVYLRDSSPGVIIGNNSNLLLNYGYVDISRQKGIAVDYLWARDMSFDDGFSKDFYFNPVEAAIADSEPDYEKPQIYGYWSPPFYLRKNDIPIMTYSLPLILSDGTVFGVIGFELETIYVGNLFNATEIPYDRGFYILCADMGGGLYNDTAIFSGAYANHFLSGPRTALSSSFVYNDENSHVYEIINPNLPGVKAIGACNEVRLYEAFSPFYNEKWVLLCMAPKSSVLSGSSGVRNSIIISIAGTIILALFLAAFITFYIAGPIRRLSEKVRNIDPEKPVRFQPTGIQEIDELSGAFEVLSDGVSEAAAKMFKILEFVDMPLGSFETGHNGNSVRLSKALFEILGIEKPGEDSSLIPMSDWMGFLATLEPDYFIRNDDGIVEILYATDSSWSAKKWFRVRQITETTRELGVLIDVTDEITQRQRFEFERNYDSLTKLLNRQAFLNKASELIKANPLSVGIMMFADLDDLKFVNDMYGHDTGDEYICRFAGFLNRFNEVGAAVGRISGDEFVMFMTGFNSREDSRAAFNDVLKGLNELSITVPDGSSHRLRVSIGLSYYPGDAGGVDELVRYADYAMYEIKHSIKGEIKEFNIGDYNRNSFVIRMKDILNLLIEEKRIYFVFQPIVDASTGEVFGYEALMRPLVREFKSPADILRVARSQSKLYQIERLTFHSVFDWIGENIEEIGGKKIFVNSIPGQVFTENDQNELRGKFSRLSKQVVFEITENEFSSQEDTKKKVGSFRDFGAMIAVDDYGSGYSNELALLSIEPDFLKIDMSIVRDVDKDIGKQQLVRNTIAYAVRKNIKVIAEGVETYEEMARLISFGVDYIQGYYLATPERNILDIPAETKNRLIEVSLSHPGRQNKNKI